MSCVAVDSVQSIPVLTLSRPPVNAVTRELLTDIHAALDQLESGGQASPFVFTATGEAFCAGLDLREIPAYSAAELIEFIRLCNLTAARLYRWPAPVVGAISGHAMGAGFVLALTPDYRVAADDHLRFGVPEIKAGIPFPAVPLTIMHAELPAAVVRRLTLTCKESSPKDAKHDGVVDELVPRDRVVERAVEVLREMANLPRDTYTRVKSQIRGATFAHIEELLTTRADPLTTTWLSSETGPAASAILDR